MLEETRKSVKIKGNWCFIRSNDGPFFETKLQSAVDGLPPFYEKCIMNLSYENAKLVVSFINSEVQLNNIKVSTKKKNPSYSHICKILKGKI